MEALLRYVNLLQRSGKNPSTIGSQRELFSDQRQKMWEIIRFFLVIINEIQWYKETDWGRRPSAPLVTETFVFTFFVLVQLTLQTDENTSLNISWQVGVQWLISASKLMSFDVSTLHREVLILFRIFHLYKHKRDVLEKYFQTFPYKLTIKWDRMTEKCPSPTILSALWH